MAKKLTIRPVKVRDNNGRSLNVAIPTTGVLKQGDIVEVFEHDADSVLVKRVKEAKK